MVEEEGANRDAQGSNPTIRARELARKHEGSATSRSQRAGAGCSESELFGIAHCLLFLTPPGSDAEAGEICVYHTLVLQCHPRCVCEEGSLPRLLNQTIEAAEVSAECVWAASWVCVRARHLRV